MLSIGSYLLLYSSQEKETEKRQRSRECLVALERPKIAPHTHTLLNTLGLLFNSGRAKERENEYTAWTGGRGKVQKCDEDTSDTETEDRMM